MRLGFVVICIERYKSRSSKWGFAILKEIASNWKSTRTPIRSYRREFCTRYSFKSEFLLGPLSALTSKWNRHSIVTKLSSINVSWLLQIEIETVNLRYQWPFRTEKIMRTIRCMLQKMWAMQILDFSKSTVRELITLAACKTGQGKQYL